MSLIAKIWFCTQGIWFGSCIPRFTIRQTLTLLMVQKDYATKWYNIFISFSIPFPLFRVPLFWGALMRACDACKNKNAKEKISFASSIVPWMKPAWKRTISEEWFDLDPRNSIEFESKFNFTSIELGNRSPSPTTTTFQ